MKNAAGIEVDKNRLSRVHVSNVRLIDKKYFVILSDARGIDCDKVDIDVWHSMSKEERWNQ